MKKNKFFGGLYGHIFCFKTIIFASICLLCGACQEKEPQTQIAFQANVCLTVKHHTEIIPNAEVWIKLNGGESLTFDGKLYDRKIVVDALGRGCFKALPTGTHWLMSSYYDPNIRQQLLGRQPLKITKIDEQQDIDMMVSE